MPGPPRNREAAERGRRLRAALREILARCSCPHCHGAPPPSAKEIAAQLPPEFLQDVPDVRYHLRLIRRGIE